MSDLRSDATQASLRDEAIAAMRAEFDRLMDSDVEGADWNSDEYAMHLLDALLDFLEAHTKEWSAAAIQRLKDRGYSRLDSVPDWESELLQSLRVEP